jgi:DNA-binding GntR family transcriptional regulator
MDSHTLAPIQFVPLKETVYRKLLNAILSGKLPPGELFTISELARQLEVSPMPVREVIKGLEAENLITVQRNGRIMIRELSVNELNELVEIRLNLELMALRKATKNCTDESIKELERLSHKVNAAQNVGEFLKRNTEFHYAIYRGANMPILLNTIQHLWSRTSPYLHIYADGGGNDHKVLSARNHGGIIEGMLERNTQKACKWLRRDLKNSAKIIISVLRN